MTRLPAIPARKLASGWQAGILTNCTNLAELPQGKEAIREIRRN